MALAEVHTTLLYVIARKYQFMTGYSGIRLRPSTKDALDRLRGQDYTIDEVVNILLDNFIEPDEDDDEDQMSLFDYDDEDDE